MPWPAWWGSRSVSVATSMRSGRRWRRKGLPPSSSTSPREGPITANAAEIARAITTAPGPVTLVTHSKGSLDALAALSGDPALAAPPRIAAWISLQAPFYGLPLADLNARDPLVARP